MASLMGDEFWSQVEISDRGLGRKHFKNADNGSRLGLLRLRRSALPRR